MRPAYPPDPSTSRMSAGLLLSAHCESRLSSRSALRPRRYEARSSALAADGEGARASERLLGAVSVGGAELEGEGVAGELVPDAQGEVDGHGLAGRPRPLHAAPGEEQAYRAAPQHPVRSRLA